MDIGGGEHRLFATVEVFFVEPALDAALALAELSSYLSIHSKSLSCWGDEKAYNLSNTAKRPRDFEISLFFT
jgi:hypothetical protein